MFEFFILLIQVAGVIMGIVGTFLNSWKMDFENKTRVIIIWTVSNMLLCYWAFVESQDLMLILYGTYFLISLYGLTNHMDMIRKLRQRGIGFKNTLLITYEEREKV